MTESALACSCLGKYLQEEGKSFYTPKEKNARNFVRETVKRGRVMALNRKLVSSSFNSRIKIFAKHFGFGLETSVLLEKYFIYKKNI